MPGLGRLGAANPARGHLGARLFNLLFFTFYAIKRTYEYLVLQNWFTRLLEHTYDFTLGIQLHFYFKLR